MKKTFFTLVIIFSSFAASAATELYQWVDENGVKHFSQQPPSHMPSLKAVDVNGAPVVSGGKPQIAPIASTSPAEDTETKKQEVERIENPEKDAERCEKARKNIAQIQEYRRVRAKDPETGELRYLDDSEKEAQLKNWQDRQNTFC